MQVNRKHKLPPEFRHCICLLNAIGGLHVSHPHIRITETSASIAREDPALLKRGFEGISTQLDVPSRDSERQKDEEVAELRSVEGEEKAQVCAASSPCFKTNG